MSGPKPTILDAIGGGANFAVMLLSAVVTVAMAIGASYAIDMNHPAPIVVLSVAAIMVGWANGWRTRGTYNDLSAECEERIEQDRIDRQAERERLAAEQAADRARKDADAQAERERLAAEAQARIDRENREHEETMRQRREEREAARVKAEEEARQSELEELKERNRMTSFNHAKPRTKQYIAQMYQHGSVEMREDDFSYLSLYLWADYTTVREDWPHLNTIVKARLTDETRKMLDESPDLLDNIDEAAAP